jgi:antibiotic biosynthesis monooxygenase (ABM) superfamily enzyme
VTPPRHRVAVVSWLAIYPTITLTLSGLEAFGINDLALPLRTLAISAIVVPTVVFVVTPALTRLLGDWLHSTPPRRRDSAS